MCGTEVLTKHHEKYMPKEVGEALKRNKKRLEAEAEAAAAQGSTMAAAVEEAKASS